MNIGIKYCGGCNPHFDRTKVLNKLIRFYIDEKFEYVKENKTYDIILVINGCNRACADHTVIEGKEVVYINSESDYEKAIDLILKHKNMKYNSDW